MVASRMCPKEPQRTWEEKPPRTLGRAIGGVSKDMSGSGPRRVPLPPPPLPPNYLIILFQATVPPFPKPKAIMFGRINEAQ